jgi:gluconolactonase
VNTREGASPAAGEADLADLLESPAERVATGASWAEGPLWLADVGQVWFSDIKGNRILCYDAESGQCREQVTDAEYCNGRTLDQQGRIVQCSHGRRRVELLHRDGSTTGLVSHVDGSDGSTGAARLNSPNDVVVAADGAIWFTDPAYGLQSVGEGHPGELEYGGCHVFRFEPDSGVLTAVVTDMTRPNGLAFSPDGSLLYVADSARAQGHGSAHDIRVYEVTADGRCENGRTFAEIDPGVPDGIRVDRHGRVWSSRRDGIVVYEPDGTKVGATAVPEVVANLCPGDADGRSLYLTATTSLYRLRLREPF